MVRRYDCSDDERSIANFNQAGDNDQLLLCTCKYYLLASYISNYQYSMCVNVGVDTSCRVGHNPTQSGHFIRAQTYLNRQFPAECDGWITAWNYCYYRSGVFEGNTYTATVAVWRFNNDTSQYTVVEDSVTELMLQIDSRPNTDIYCRQEMLDPEYHIRIRQGDIIGVLLPTTNAIPMIGNNNMDGYEIWVNETAALAPDPSNISLSSLSAELRSVHLYADISVGE